MCTLKFFPADFHLHLHKKSNFFGAEKRVVSKKRLRGAASFFCVEHNNIGDSAAKEATADKFDPHGDQPILRVKTV